MKRLQPIILSMLLCLMCLQLHAQAKLSLTKSIALNDSKNIEFLLPGEAIFQTWDKDYARMVLHISSEEVGSDILRVLVSAGRYDIHSELLANKLLISTPKMANRVTIKGAELVEDIYFEIFVPEGVTTSVQLPSYYQGEYLKKTP